MLKSEMSDSQRDKLALFVTRLDEAGWRASEWDALLDRGVPCQPEGHGELETVRASLVLELDLERDLLTLLMMSRGALTPVTLHTAPGTQLAPMLDTLLERATSLSLEGLPAFLEHVLPHWSETSLSVGTEVVALDALCAGEIDLMAMANNFALYYDRGLAASEDEEWEIAAVAFGEVTRLRPDFAEAWHHLGHALAAMGQEVESRVSLVRAVECYDAQARKEPDDAAYASYWKACALTALGEYDEALCSLRGALKAVPHYRNLARVEADLLPLESDPRFVALLS